MIEQLILHLLGDFILQTDWQAANKKKASWIGEIACQIHCILYSIPFILITDYIHVILIYVSHYAIDRTNVITWFLSFRNLTFTRINFGSNTKKPVHISFFVYTFVDMFFHLTTNYFILLH